MRGLGAGLSTQCLYSLLLDNSSVWHCLWLRRGKNEDGDKRTAQNQWRLV